MNNNWFDRLNPFAKKDEEKSTDDPSQTDEKEATALPEVDRADSAPDNPADEPKPSETANPPATLNVEKIDSLSQEPTSSNFWDSTVQSVSNTVGGIGESAANTGNAIGKSVQQTGETIVKSVGTVGEKLVKVPTEMGSNVSKSVAGTVGGVGSTIGQLATNVGKTIGKVPKEIGSTLNLIRRNPILKKLTQNLKISPLLNAINAVDVVAAETEVRRLQEQYPEEKPDEIAHRLMVAKALLVAGSGLATSLVPGAALALVGVDLAATTGLSAELLYQIAAAYGMDLQEIDRQGEALAIFGLSTGGNLAIQAGINLVGTVPVAGAVINASASAAMIYALGYGACRFYEAQLNANKIDTKLEVFEEVLQTESDRYVEFAIDQQTAMDWILVHMVLAGNPQKTWEQILLDLQAANLSPASLEKISAQIQNPPEIQTLLDRLDRDFAVPLLDRCQTIANFDNKITPEEAQLIDLISRKAEQKIKEDETVDLDVALPDDRETAIPASSRKNLGTVLLETLQDILTRETKFDRQELGYLVDRVDRMSGEQFEEFLAECFQRLGYTANTTPKTNDFGADLILIKDGRKTVVQAKRYQGKVGNSAVQEVVAAVRYYEANNAIVATNSQFTPNARELARANNVQLWEREQLIDLILRAQNAV